MKQGKIVAAYKTLMRLNKVPGLPFSLCNKLFMKKRELEPYFQSQREQENVLIEASGQKPDEGYDLTPEIKREIRKIAETDVDYEVNPVEISLTDEQCEKLGLTGEIMEILDGFIKFTGV